ncbi:MAG TPA: hypothetical protein VMU69_27965 [Bradyrhizobium sp.]|nr:hypothetical protein [Bradyrhizobium sp.]
MKSTASVLVVVGVLAAPPGRIDARESCTVKVLDAELLPYAPFGSWLTTATIEVRSARELPFDVTVREILPWQMAIRRGEKFRVPCELAAAPSLAALATAPSFRSASSVSSRYARIR